MSISDMIVVMKEGIVQQIGRPQEVYDNPANLFVARFLGTPPVNVFDGKIRDGRLYIGAEAVLEGLEVFADPMPEEVCVAVRPEGFRLRENGVLSCELSGVEIMGRDISVVSRNKFSLNPQIRSIISTENQPDFESHVVRFDLIPRKVFVFRRDTEERIGFAVSGGGVQ